MVTISSRVPQYRARQLAPGHKASSTRQNVVRSKAKLDLFPNVGDQAASLDTVPANYFEGLLASGTALNPSWINAASGSLALPRSLAWILPAFKLVYVMANADKSKAWFLPVQGSIADVGQNGSVNFDLPPDKKQKFDELKGLGFTPQTVCAQRKTGDTQSSIFWTLNQLGTPNEPEAYINDKPFIEDISRFILTAIASRFNIDTTIRPGDRDEGTPYLLYFRVPDCRAGDDATAPKVVKPLLLLANISRADAIKEITCPGVADWVAALFEKLPYCNGLRTSLQSIPGMNFTVDYNAEKSLSEIENKRLLINPGLAKYGAVDGFMDTVMHIALHLGAQGDDPNTPFTVEQKEKIDDNIQNITLEQFKQRYHNILGDAIFTIADIPEKLVEGKNDELRPLLQYYREKYFEIGGQNLWAQVKPIWENKATLPDARQQVSALFDPDGARASNLYNVLLAKSQHPNVPAWTPSSSSGSSGSSGNAG